jgi:RNA binding exosome subunit
MSSLPLHYVDLRAFSYATEDEQRVAEALRYYLPGETELDRASTEGFHGDRIVVLSARVERADDVRVVLRRLAEFEGIEGVVEELDERVDDNCAFHLTLDKQAAYRGEVALGDGLVLRGKIEAYPAKKQIAVENLRELLADL